MRIRRFISCCLAAALTLVQMSGVSSNAVEGDMGYTEAQINASKIKPKLTMSKIVVPLSIVKSGEAVEIEINVEGAANELACYDLYMGVDSRMDFFGDTIMKGGEVCGHSPSAERSMGKYNPLGNTLFFSSVGASDKKDYCIGDGVLFKFDVLISSDVKGGDILPLDLFYYENDFGFARFTNDPKAFKGEFSTEEGKLMNAYTFTKGINTPNNPSTDPILLAAGHPEADGYVLIVDDIGAEGGLGDLDGDGIIDASDASAVLAEYAAVQTGAAPSVDKSVGDVNGDDFIDASDASSILQYFAYTQTGGSDSIQDFLSQQ